MVRGRKCHCRVTWELRNNSSNVAAILNPEDYSFEQNKTDDGYHLRNNVCYCREKNIRPQLFSRPKKCIFNDDDDDDDDDNIRIKFPTRRWNEIGYSPPKFKSPSRLTYTVDKTNSYFNNSRPEISPRLTYRTRSNDRALPQTHDSQELGAAYQKPGNIVGSSYGAVASRNSDEERQFESNTHPNHQSAEEDTRDNIETFTNFHPDYDETGETTSRNYNESSELKQLSDFRKDHYFETHSTEDLVKSVPEHTCVHRFGLDNRFLPEALNADVYGVSRCIICGKPMENPTVTTQDERFRKNKKGTFPKFYKYGLAPKRVYVGGDGGVRIEMVMGDGWKEGWECKEKRPNYFNTYALKYQKGVK